VTTIPAVGTLSLSVATLDRHFALESLYQLGINVGGIIAAGVLTLALQRVAWARLRPGSGGRSRRTRGRTAT
jgi:hypothetical protein